MMCNGFINPIFGNRLKYLYSSKGIDVDTERGWSIIIAKELYECGMLEYKEYPEYESCAEKTESQQRNDTARLLRNHLTYTKPCDYKWIIIYCEYFHCSSDYLMGLIDKPTHELSTINELTGLSDRAIEKMIYKIAPHPYFPVVLSTLLESNNCEYYLALLLSRFSSSQWPNRDDEIVEVTIFGKEARIEANGLLDSVFSTHIVQDMPSLSTAYIECLHRMKNKMIESPQ